MSRTVNALIALGFGYTRFAIAIVSGLVILPLTLAYVDHTVYGRWLVVMELLSYLGFAELGVATVLPWLVAERDGRGNQSELRQLVADAGGCCTISIVAYLLGFVGLWHFGPSMFGQAEGAGSAFGMGVLLVAIGTVISFYGRIYSSVLNGLQDYLFLGVLMLIQSVVGLAATIALLIYGAGPIALAVGLMLPLLVGSAGATWRIRRRHPDLLLKLPRPSLNGMKRLAGDSLAAWLGGIGGRLTLGSYALLIAASGGSPVDIIRFTATAKLGELLMQQSWMVVDSGLVGMAQLWGQQQRARVRELTLMMIRFTLVAGGAVLIVILGFNPGFVSLWLGADKFGGSALNQALAVMAFSLCLSHVLAVTAAVLGQRRLVGATNLICGVIYVAVAMVFGRWFGAKGVAWANTLVSAVVAVPLLVYCLRRKTQVGFDDFGRELFQVWLPGAALPLALAASVGFLPTFNDPLTGAAVTALAGIIYCLMMRTLCSQLPWPARWRRLGERLRVIAPLAT